MKRSGAVIIFFMLSLTGFSQHAQNTLALSVSENDRISVIKSSVRLAEWHEKSFWPLYDKYFNDAVKVYSLTYRSLKDLAETEKNVNDQEAFENGKKLLRYRNDELALRKHYYLEMGGVLNGVVALQFLQTEAMMDMIESSAIYGRSSYRNFRFQPTALSSEQFKSAKHNTLSTALSLSPEEKDLFWKVYYKYEAECDALLGADYSIYALFASDAADFTPALAKRLGNDLLLVMEREVRLKEKYFLEMNAAGGSSLAARFLAWEDYYSVISKMYAWAETP